MSLSDLAAIGSFVSGIAVLVSLVFLYFQLSQINQQVRQTQVVERSNGQRDLLAQSGRHLAILRHDEALFDAICECLQEYSTAARFKKNQFHTWAWDFLFVMEQAVYQHREGLLNKASFDGFTQYMTAIINTPGGTQWWWDEAYKIVGSDVGEYLAAYLRGPGKSTPPITDLIRCYKLPEAANASAP